MDLKTMEWIVQGLRRELEALQSEVKQLRMQLKTKQPSTDTLKSDDELIDTKEVRKMLGICYNTLQKIILAGKITPIKLGARNIRFWRSAVLNYLREIQTN